MAVVNKYEVVMIFSVKEGEERATALFEKFKGLIEQNATVSAVDEWGKRRLAYPINDEAEGVYYLVNFESNPEFLAELDRVFNITDGVLRTLVVKKD